LIEIFKHIDLNESIKNKLKSYIKIEFGHIPIVNETEWAIPDWTIIYFENKQITTFYNIVEREIIIDDKVFKIGGINNVITPKKFRGMGYASKTLRDTEKVIFDILKCDLGVLLCADELISFYERLNWYKVECSVYFEQSDGKKLWKANTMILPKEKKLNPKRIELNGLPW
jgi:hypothetical protein